MWNERVSNNTFLTLNSEKVLLEIIPKKGGRISRYCVKNKEKTFELLRPIKRSQPINKDSCEKITFPLIPFSNRIRKGQFSFEGKQINLPLNFPPEIHSIHGHGWEKQWSVIELKKTAAILEYRHFPDEWPFPYLAHQILEINDSNLIITIQIKNTGNSAMPVGLGIHPYFLRTPNSFVIAKTKKMWINDSEKMPLYEETTPEIKLLYDGLNIDKNILDNIFTGWDHRVKISWPEWKVNLNISAIDPLDYLVIYSPSGEDYFCVEPVSNITNAFNMMDRSKSCHGVKILNPDETIKGKVSFSPEFF